MKKELPLISIIIPTLNNEKDFPDFLHSIKIQTYPRNKLEVLIIDGGSKDKTRLLAKKNGFKVIPNPLVLAEPGVTLGMEKANGELMMVLAMDNIFKDPHAFEKIAKVFEDKSIFAALPKQDYEKNDNLFTKYHNTFTDPFNHFINGYASNTRTFHKIYDTLVHTNIYDVYDFQSNPNLPMMSFSQGFTIRKNYRRKEEDALDDVSPIINLIKEDKKIAYIHSLSLYHHTINNVGHFIRKQRWATQNALERKKYGIAHRYTQLSFNQKMRTFLWPFYSLSIVFPTLRAIQGLIQDRELLWLFHPVECFICGYANAIQLLEFIKGKIQQKNINYSRQ